MFICKLYDIGLFDHSRKYYESERNAYDKYVNLLSNILATLWGDQLGFGFVFDSIENRLNQDDNFFTILEAYSSISGSSSQAATPANDEETKKYRKDSRLETAIVGSSFKDLHLNQNLVAPLVIHQSKFNLK